MRNIRYFLLVIHKQTPDLAHTPYQAPPPKSDKSAWVVPILAAIITAVATVTSAFLTAQSKQPAVGISATAPSPPTPQVLYKPVQ